MKLKRREFNRLLLGTAGAACLTGISAPALAAPNANTILAQSDAIRNPQTSFVVDVTLSAYNKGRLTDRTKVSTHSRTDRGQFQTLVHINAPSVDRGKILLRNANILWLYDPSSKASVRISPRQRLLGNASNGDVISSNLVGDYTPTLVGEEVIVDGDKKSRKCYKLALKSKNKSAPYSSIDFWVDASNSRPIKGKYYTKSGELIKVAWYRKWKNQMGATRPTEVVIADGFDPNKVTVMSMGGFRPKKLPQSWFRKEWLPQFEL